jgi:hypothetical protein
MSFALLLAALAIAGVGALIGRRWRVFGQAMMGLGGLGLIAVIVVQLRQNVFQPQSKSPNRYQMAVSHVLANSMLAELAGQSGKVVLLFPRRRDMDAHTEESYEDGFLPPLRHGRGQLDLKAVHLEAANSDLSAFKQALAQTPEAIAVVSYASVPPDFESLFSGTPTASPPFFVFDGVDPHSAPGVTGMPDTIFDRFYLLATLANADEVADSLKH